MIDLALLMRIVPLAPEAIIFSAGLLIFVAGLILPDDEKNKIGTVLSIPAILTALYITLKTMNVHQSFFHDTIVVDAFGQFFNIIFLIVALLVSIASLRYYRNNPNQDEYYGLLLFATAGMMTVAISNDLIALFLGFELASLSTYVMAGFNKTNKTNMRTVEAAMKYFVIGSLSSAFLLFGISYLYGLTGTTNIQGISVALTAPSPLAVLGMVFIIVGLGFKMALVPFHMWAPDAYEGAPAVVTALMAAGSKKMAFVAAFRIFAVALVALKLEWYMAFAVLAAVTMTLGNVVALVQNNIKRMLAYSSIAHAGYITIALVVLAHSDQAAPIAIAGGILHAFSHAVMTVGVFIVAAMVAGMAFDEWKEEEFSVCRLDSYKEDIYHLKKFEGLGAKAPATALLMTIMLFSLAGVPPTLGFYTKFVLFLSAIKGELLWLALLGVLNSAVSLFYYARIIMYMYWGKPTAGALKEPPAYMASLVLAAIIVIALGIYPQPIYDLAINAAEALLGGS